MPAIAAAFSSVDRERGLRRNRALDEEPRSAVLLQRVVHERPERIGNRQRRHGERHFPTQVERLAARREDLRLGPGMEERVRELRACLQQVLAIVENDQHLPVPYEPRQRFADGTSGLLLHPHYGCDGLRHESRIGERCELDQPHAVREIVHQPPSDLQRQPRLADAADTGERHQPVLREQLRNVLDLALAADERRQGLGQVVRRCGERAQRREIGAEVRVLNLEDTLGTCEVAQAHFAQVAQRDPRGEPLLHERGHRLREQDLPAVGDAHESCRAIHRAAEIVVVALLLDARVKARTNGEP